jgi:hypothetical protein
MTSRIIAIASTLIIALVISCGGTTGNEYHVSSAGDDTNIGTASQPLRTIQAAANLAQPGDVITVHEGVYRERINPPRGGASDDQRIVYRAAEGETVEIKGSEVIKDWEPQGNGVWKMTLPNAFFGAYNPYQDSIWGDWFTDMGRIHHTGEVYLNGKSLYEMEALEKVRNPAPIEKIRYYRGNVKHHDEIGSTYTWYCNVDDAQTTIWANFHDYNPNEELVEINAREACFYPDQPGRNYITVSGFRMSQAATQWAAPTAEQIGLIGTHYSKGWIIEDNVIHDSKCSGLTLGKDRASGHNVWLKNPEKDGATHYNEVIQRALDAGWSKETVGSHIVRNNTIYNCGQTGMCASLGAIFSTIENNHIYNIWTKRLFKGMEIAAIKIHGPIDVTITNNHLHNAGRGLWMDWMSQGTYIAGNLLYDNDVDDMHIEVNHGPFFVVNNLFLSQVSLRNTSEGGAYAHNLFGGLLIQNTSLGRFTPHHQPHSTELAGLSNTQGGDDRFYNNIFVGGFDMSDFAEVKQWKFGTGLETLNDEDLRPSIAAGNVYLNGAVRYKGETNCAEYAINPKIRIEQQGDGLRLHLTLNTVDLSEMSVPVLSAMLGTPAVTGLSYEKPDGSSLTVEADFMGMERNYEHPSAGPFETPGTGRVNIRVK